MSRASLLHHARTVALAILASAALGMAACHHDQAAEPTSPSAETRPVPEDKAPKRPAPLTPPPPPIPGHTSR
ncbi:MAG TPA: hypothetical protein VHC70_00525 [Phycisphaerales bacterium]|jgi:hypothetical protein|nr:hypothetical protein [Phycisphaerales bacterium]